MSENGVIRVVIPTPLRQFTGGQAQVTGQGSTIRELIADLDARFPGLKARICEPDGEIRRFVNVFVNGENVRKGLGAATPLKPGDEVGIIPAMAGGSASLQR